MKLPCETGVWLILPCIRACLVQELIIKGLPQKQVAQMLEITPASVSQYASKKRGCKIELDTEVIGSIRELADDMVAERVGHMGLRMCDICMQVRSGGLIEDDGGPCARTMFCNISPQHDTEEQI
ncbi:transcriptional regulator [Methanofollis aquaemaris]|uniref:transcriptional regulator n=1 Tax=Methanofollis aquaemaris TaxID=126734 RepID=UPI00223F9BEB|nr:transcriptional regulator [Methanofollis aquaemaris]